MGGYEPGVVVYTPGNSGLPASAVGVCGQVVPADDETLKRAAEVAWVVPVPPFCRYYGTLQRFTVNASL